jgi:hypothetical protein
MRHGKAIRWHVDVLTEAGTGLGVWTFPGGDECDLVAALSHFSADRRLRKHRLPEVQEHLLNADRFLALVDRLEPRGLKRDAA